MRRSGARGFLTGKIDTTTQFDASDFRNISPRFAADARPANMALVDLLKRVAVERGATPAQLALAWLMAQKPWIVPILGTTQMAHMLDNVGAAEVRLAPAELAELDAAVAAIRIRGARLPDPVLVFSGVEAPPKR